VHTKKKGGRQQCHFPSSLLERMSQTVIVIDDLVIPQVSFDAPKPKSDTETQENQLQADMDQFEAEHPAECKADDDDDDSNKRKATDEEEEEEPHVLQYIYSGDEDGMLCIMSSQEFPSRTSAVNEADRWINLIMATEHDEDPDNLTAKGERIAYSLREYLLSDENIFLEKDQKTFIVSPLIKGRLPKAKKIKMLKEFY
jgi:hypothetical protein